MTITNAQMLAAARARLAEHLETRPATATEAQANVDTHRSAAQNLREKAEAMRARTIPCGWDRPENAAQIGADRTRAAEEMESRALKEEMAADSWEAAAGGAPIWEQTRSELQERVDYYRGSSK